MPAVLKIDPQRRIVSSTFYGEVTGGDLLRQRDLILADANFNPAFADVVDFSSVTTAAVADSALGALASTRSVFDDSVPHIIIAPQDWPHELALKYRDLARVTRPNLHVVRSATEANDLLRSLGFTM